MARLPKNIREGKTVDQVIEYLADKDYPQGKFFAHVASFDHGLDTCGNRIAHYVVTLRLDCPNDQSFEILSIVESGHRREQIGYGGANQAAKYALQMLGFDIDYSNENSTDRMWVALYPIKNKLV